MCFKQIAERRKTCPYSSVGSATVDEELVVTESWRGRTLFAENGRHSLVAPQNIETGTRAVFTGPSTSDNEENTKGQIQRLLIHTKAMSASCANPFRGQKHSSYHGDRSVSGLVTRDQMVGEGQVFRCSCSTRPTGLTCAQVKP